MFFHFFLHFPLRNCLRYKDMTLEWAWEQTQMQLYVLQTVFKGLSKLFVNRSVWKSIDRWTLPTFYFRTVCTVSATCSIIFYNVTFSVYSFICFFQKVTLSTIWFVVYDGMPCWNMIGKNEDWLLYTNTGQAFNIDTISLETSQYFTSTDFLCFFYWSASCKKPCQSPCIPPIIGVADMDLLCVERTLKWLCQTFEGSTHPRLR